MEDLGLRAQRAQALLHDPILKAAFQTARERYRSEWEKARPNDVETQRIAHMKFHALKDVLAELNRHITNAHPEMLKAKVQAAERRAQYQEFSQIQKARSLYSS
jgi:hypothetical protein